MASMAEQVEDVGAAGSLLGSWSDEAELVERARTQPEAFGHLYDRYYSVVLNYVFRRTLDVALAEELSSNTFFNALRALGGYENRGKFLAWLYRIAGNEIRLNWRARRKQHEGEARWRAELGRVRFATDRVIATETEEVEEQARQFARLHEALSRLPERYQTILALRYFESLSCEEVAEVVGTKVGTVKSLIHRGLKQLRRQYEGDPATFERNLH
jgi:RNA polymerase sigma-70 factor, ECF subfamily